MVRLNLTWLVVAASVAVTSGQGTPPAAGQADLAGTWALNRELSQFPREVGFGMDVVPSGRSGSAEASGAAGVGASGNPRSLTTKPQTEQEARNTRQLVDEARNPPARLTITQTGAVVTLSDGRGRPRTFQATGRDESVPLDAGPIAAVSRWEGARLVVRYKVETGREVRYTYARRTDPPQLVVQTEFLERGGHDIVTRVYDPAPAGEPAASGVPAAAGRAALPSALPALPSQREGAPQQAPPATVPDPARLVPAQGRAAPGDLDQRPDAELKGITTLGVVVEELGPASATCGLRQAPLESAVTNGLTGAGLKVVRNTDEDTYLYVHVVTTAMTTGFCFSRYDVTLYTHTTATPTYGLRPVLVQVQLAHKGGLSGGGANSHGDAVVKAVAQYVGQLAGRVRDANK